MNGPGYSTGSAPSLNRPVGASFVLTRVGLTHHNANRPIVVDGPGIMIRPVAKRQVTGPAR